MNPVPALGLKLDLHHFTSERGIALAGEGLAVAEQNALGKEVDLSAKYKYNKNFSLAAGASVFLADDLMKTVIGQRTASWFYLMTVVNF